MLLRKGGLFYSKIFLYVIESSSLWSNERPKRRRHRVRTGLLVRRMQFPSTKKQQGQYPYVDNVVAYFPAVRKAPTARYDNGYID